MCSDKNCINPIYYKDSGTLLVPEYIYDNIENENGMIFIKIPGAQVGISKNILEITYQHDQDNMSFYEIKNDLIVKILKDKQDKKCYIINKDNKIFDISIL